MYVLFFKNAPACANTSHLLIHFIFNKERKSINDVFNLDSPRHYKEDDTSVVMDVSVLKVGY